MIRSHLIQFAWRSSTAETGGTHKNKAGRAVYFSFDFLLERTAVTRIASTSFFFSSLFNAIDRGVLSSNKNNTYISADIKNWAVPSFGVCSFSDEKRHEACVYLDSETPATLLHGCVVHGN